MVITLSKMMNREWYGQIPEENYFLEAVCKEKDAPFTGIYRREKKKKEYQKDVMTTEASSGENDFSMVWSRRESGTGIYRIYSEYRKYVCDRYGQFRPCDVKR